MDILLTSEGRDLQEQAASIPEKFAGELDLTFEEYSGLLTRLKQLTARLHVRKRANAR